MMKTSKHFPGPQRERWQPLRSGFLNLYRFDEEEFYYENGRLLLRGNNGTGKSRILALQLPFLLDGEVTPQRLEPDADPAKRMEWNLLMGRYADRTGYTWVEFGRRDAEGLEHYFTIGCGLSAVEEQSGVRKWFFTTTQRIGRDLQLASETRQVLGKDRLRERIGSAGQVFDDVGRYRRAVNEALFGLDDYRYGSLMNLLIQLRRPQLSRRLDENELSRSLSEALRPVSPAVIASVAEAFRSLESEHGELECLKTASSAVERFMTNYRRYVEVAAKRRADRVLSAHREYEAGMKEILVSEAECDRSLADLARLKSEIQRLTVEQHAVETEIAALERAPHLKDSHALDRAHTEAKEKRSEAQLAAADLADAVQSRKLRTEEHVRIKAVLEQCQTRVKAATDAAAQAASVAGLEASYREFVALLDLQHGSDEAGLKKVRAGLENAVQVQRDKAQHILKLSRRVITAKDELAQVCLLRDQLAGLLDDSSERLNAAREEHKAAAASFLRAFNDWRDGLSELPMNTDDAFLNTLTEWCDNPRFVNPLAVEIRAGLEETTRKSAELRAEFQVLHKQHATELYRVKEERERLAAGAVAENHSRPGAPLWMLCDFAEGVDMESRAGIEAGLAAAGLLDAWVLPSGELLDPQNGDAVLVAAASPLPAEDAHLGLLLVPVQAPLDLANQAPPYVVEDILRHIGSKADAGHVWISADGQWQNGPLRGRQTKTTAEYIGQAAREMARWRRILDLDTIISETQARVDSLSLSMQELNQRDRVARNEADAAPFDEHVREAYEHAAALGREVSGLRNRLAEAEDDVAQKEDRVAQTLQNRDRSILDLGLARWANDPESLESALSNYRVALSSYWPAIDSLAEARAAGQIAWKLVEEAGSRERRQKEISDRAEYAAIAAETARDTLKRSVNAGTDQAVFQIEEVRRRLSELKSLEKDKRRRHHDMELAVTRLDERLRNRTEMLNGETDRRDTAASALCALARTKLLQLAVPGIVDDDATIWSTARTVEAAFDLSSRLEAVESGDSLWDYLQKSVPSQFNELVRMLSAQDCHPSATFCDDVFVATALFRAKEYTLEELRQALSAEVAARQMLIDAREREILEQRLAGEVAPHLHELLTAASEQVRQMNIELESCPMSTGMKLRFVWTPAEDGPPGLVEVQRRLLRSNRTWSAADCKMLGAFLQQQIQAVCAQMENGTWHESLAEALDYRKWHRFAVERYQDGVWKRLTRRTHGTGSGGEKAVALTLPHFAAAAAFYRTADPLAPRLILLDEAFVGIDADMRGKCMGLINTLDLDFIMTSEREWGCYATLPGLAIYQLSTRPGIEAIGLTRWVWNGRQRVLKQNLNGAEDITNLVAGD